MRNAHCKNWNMAIKLENGKKLETHMIGPGIQWETLKKLENETQTLYDLEYGEKSLKNVENEKCTLQDQEYGKKKNENNGQ